VEQGTHDELMRGGGYYQHVLELQRMTAAESMKDILNKDPEPINTFR